jgi:hypothetical protein
MLGKMSGMKSIRRNLRTEDEAYERSLDQNEDYINGPYTRPKRNEDDMDIMVAHGDVHIYEPASRQREEKRESVTAKTPALPVVQPPASPAPAPASPSSPSEASLIPDWVKTAGLLGAGLGTGAGLAALFMPSAPRPTSTTIVQPIDPHENPHFKFLPPERYTPNQEGR